MKTNRWLVSTVILGLALVGVVVFGVMTFQQLGQTKDALASIQQQLQTTLAEKDVIKTERDNLNGELAGVKSQLKDTQADFKDTTSQLAANVSALYYAKTEVKNYQSKLASTEVSLQSSESQVSRLDGKVKDTEKMLSAAEGTLDGLGISIMQSALCFDVELTDNPAAKNPTLAELTAFVELDKTDQEAYVLNVYDCSQFSRDFHNNAEAAGIRTAEVQVSFEDKQTGHALNAVITSDFGLVYVDCTVEDSFSRVVVGEEYRGAPPTLITGPKVRDTGWWGSLTRYYYLLDSSGNHARPSRIVFFW